MTTFANPMASRPLTLRLSTSAELMTRNPLTIHKNMPIHKAAELFSSRGLEAAPITDEAGRPTGILTAAACDAWTEFSRRCSQQRIWHSAIDWTPVQEIASPYIKTVRNDAPIREVVHRLSQRRVPRIYVVNELDQLVGVISVRDVLRHLAGSTTEADPTATSC